MLKGLLAEVHRPPGRVLVSTFWTCEFDREPLHGALQSCFFTAIIHTGLTKVVRRIIARVFLFERKSKDICRKLDQFVSVPISAKFFQLLHLIFKPMNSRQKLTFALGGLNPILLHGQYLSPEMSELNSEFMGGRRDLCIIKCLYCGFVGTNGMRNTRQVAHYIHGGLPIGESSGVGTTDSTDLETPAPTTPDQDNKILIGPTDI